MVTKFPKPNFFTDVACFFRRDQLSGIYLPILPDRYKTTFLEGLMTSYVRPCGLEDEIISRLSRKYPFRRFFMPTGKEIA